MRGFLLAGGGITLVVVGAAVGPVLSETVSISGTMVTLRPSGEPGAVAEVVMENVSQNGPGDDGGYDLAMPGLVVGAEFTWEADEFTGADGLQVLPPDGMICEPQSCLMIVPEGQTGRVLLLEWLGG